MASQPLDHSKTLLFLTFMGVTGLWKELEPIEQKLSLSHLAVQTGFLGNATGIRGYRVGIDASGWMCRATARHGITESPELVALFSRCSRLFRLPFIPVFVFDGPERPCVKRGKIVSGTAHGLESLFQHMLNGFGFDWIIARGEAEATLSAMTTSGIPVRVDAILTDDSDSFVFGASSVLRIRSEDNENYEASLYSSSDIAAVLGLCREDFVLIAILAGGDYSSGLAKCGVTIAMGLARAGLGMQLVSGLSGKSQADSVLFLNAWRDALRSELRTNASGHLPHVCKQLAENIPTDFPDLEVINLYLHPIVSDHAAPALAFHQPRLDILASFAEDHFGWGNSIGILEHFRDQLFGGLVIRELINRALVSDDGSAAALQLPSIIKTIVGDRRHRSTGALAELRLTLSLDSTILTAAVQAISGRRDPAQSTQAAVATWITTTLPKARAWAPKAMVEHVHPGIVLDYICAQTNRKARKKHQVIRLANPIMLPPTASTSSLVARHAASSYTRKANSSSAPREKRYTTMSVTYQGQEIVELITDSEGEI